MAYFLLGCGIGTLVAAVINWKFKQGPVWIKTRTLVIVGLLFLVAGLLEVYRPGILPQM